MKGGKGGTGRKRPTPKPDTKRANPHDGPKRGAPKKDWGAIPKDDFDTPAPKRK
jgi:hypothetical protein